MREGSFTGGVLAAAIALLSGTPAAGQATVRARVVDQAGRPLPQVVVFAADAGRVLGMAQSDQAGTVELPRPHPRYNFGVMSPSLRLHGVTPRGPGRFDLITVALPAAPTGEGSDPQVLTITARGASVFHGRVLDEAGRGLQGVRVEAARATGPIASTVLSTTGGDFALVVPGGTFALRASAPGLVPLRGAREGERLVVVMTVATSIQTVTVTTGRTLSFRTSDSVDPEYAPPAPVRAWLQFAYGICPSAGPLRAHEKRALKKYWYLDVLRLEPPNPATISTLTCVPPSAADRLAAGQGTTQGFEIWEDGVVAPLLR